jgi:hypothetical protein
MGGSGATGLGLDKVSCVGRDFESHVAGVLSDDAVKIGAEVVHEHNGLFDGFGGGCCLFGGDLVECTEDGWVTGASVVVHEGCH